MDTTPVAEPAAPAGESSSEAEPPATAEVGPELSEAEYNQLLDAVGENPSQTTGADAAPAGKGSDLITEDEFDALLDDLHGKGKAPGVVHAKPAPAAAAAAAMAAANSDDISEAEFEALLDQLHGNGKGPGVSQAPAPAEKPALAVVKAEPEAQAPAAPVPAAPAAVAQPAASTPTPKPAQSAPSAPAAAHAPAQPAAETTIRVETNVLDRIMNMVGELVLIRNRLATLQNTIANDEMSKTVSALDVVTSDLQTAAMKTRMQPIKKVFGRFPRVVRDLARSLKKEIHLELMGEETDLDKNLVEALADPLVHLVRNAVDHGIEMPETREAAGKSRVGTVTLSAEQEGDHILLTISDDGAGMDPEKLRSKAVEKGLMDADAAGRLSDRECFELIFAAGFSTKTEISDVSGRGVGMDVVKTRIAQLNGTISIDSTAGKGSIIQIKVPLTLAIMPTLMVVLGKQIFALPLVSVGEIIDFDMGKVNRVDGQQVMVVRGKALPFFYLSEWLVRGAEPYSGTSGHVVVVSVGTQRVGLLVDQLIGQEEVVIKPLGALLQGTQGLAGATITGDGRIALILDLPSLIGTYARMAA
jgi:two-component system chemotaxis sensor kinase CheA